MRCDTKQPENTILFPDSTKCACPLVSSTCRYIMAHTLMHYFLAFCFVADCFIPFIEERLSDSCSVVCFYSSFQSVPLTFLNRVNNNKQHHVSCELV